MYVQLLVIILSFLALRWFPQIGTEENQKRQHTKYIIFLMVLLTLQSGLRHLAVGPDTYAYYLKFIEVQQTSWHQLWQNCLNFYHFGEGKDPGYYLLLKAIQLVLPTNQLYLLGLAAFVFYGLGKMLNTFTESNHEVMLSMALYQCLYYSFFSITGHRQTMATAFLLLAIPSVLKRKPAQFLVLVLIAATQHKSALLFLPFFFVPLIKHPRFMLVISFVMFIVMWFIGGDMAKYFMVNTEMDQYASYLEEYEGAGAYGFAAYILLLGVLLIYYCNSISIEHKNAKLILNSIAIAIILTPLTMINPSNMRIVQYYSIFGLVALPWVVKNIPISDNVNLRYIIVSVVLTVYTIFRNSPYAFFWQEMALRSNY